MTLAVLRLLEEAQATLDRKVTTTRRKKAPFTITTSIKSIGSRNKTIPPPTWDHCSRYETSQQKLNETFESLVNQFNKEDDRTRPTPLISPKSIRRLSLQPLPTPTFEKHSYQDEEDLHHYNDYSPPPSPLPRQTMELSYWALYDNNDDEDEDDEDEEDETNGSTLLAGHDHDKILTSATSRSVKLVHSCLSPLLRFASPSTYSTTTEDLGHDLPPLPPSTSTSSSLLSSSSSYSISSLASSSSSSSSTTQQNTTTSRYKRQQQLCRIAFNVLVISRLLLHRHHHPSSSFNNNLHLLRPQHQHLWRQYLLVVFGSSPSISPLPYMCQQMPRLFFIIQFIYSLSS
ncbi:hypothetical protein BC941DRAFT_420555 [Chlamydoabsidia padenii]|nr:hypothetical protein BC941DRAFT_420555 [Chlamydoabsidia padenii]